MDNVTKETDVRSLATEFMMYRVGMYSFFSTVIKREYKAIVFHWPIRLKSNYKLLKLSLTNLNRVS